jgi:hypothetical protein
MALFGEEQRELPVTVTLIATAFVVFVASSVLVAIWPQRVLVDEADTRTAGQLGKLSSATTVQRV